MTVKEILVWMPIGSDSDPKYAKYIIRSITMSFTFEFTPEKLAACIRNPSVGDWYETIVNVLPEYEINNAERVAMWLAQMGHESGDFKSLSENLNYGAKGLMGTWPRYFSTEAVANQYARKPEMIANRAYASRMGNGPEESGEGWKFRGRGIIQITGKSNYTQCSQTLYGDANILLEQPEILCEIDGAVRSACWFWNSRNLNSLSDAHDVLGVTKKINGGTHGLDDRTKRWNNNLQTLAN